MQHGVAMPKVCAAVIPHLVAREVSRTAVILYTCDGKAIIS
jgi:hypothetical protein